ncbi:hypothetical protein [Azotobacter beijerinckii]|nr:hypothetical protein [Azotobacter beijerinckii]MDV7211068.1 hypothetical protein [Azotobacter beijerinckii]
MTARQRLTQLLNLPGLVAWPLLAAQVGRRHGRHMPSSTRN